MLLAPNVYTLLYINKYVLTILNNYTKGPELWFISKEPYRLIGRGVIISLG